MVKETLRMKKLEYKTSEIEVDQRHDDPMTLRELQQTELKIKWSKMGVFTFGSGY